MIKLEKTSDAIQLENLSKLISDYTLSPSSEKLQLLAHGLCNALNLCIKHMDKEPIKKPSLVCPRCNSCDILIHGKAKTSLFCPKCFKIFPSSTSLNFCPDCPPQNELIKVATQKIRYRCKNCKTTYMEGAGSPTNFNKFIFFSYLIYNTKLSYSQIIYQLKISSDTYYRWKKRLAIYYPNTQAYICASRNKSRFMS